MSYLNKIIEYKKEELKEIKRSAPLSEIKQKLDSNPYKKRSLKDSLLKKPPGIIAEIKRKSPSKGELRSICDAAEIARQYDDSGAAAVSVLTDEKYFGGSLEDLNKIKHRVKIPVLRKDFIIDPYQMYESKFYGADAVLLITSILEVEEFAGLYGLAGELGLEVLVETETESDIQKVDGIKIEIIGVNNRNLHTFEQAIETSFKLLNSLPPESVKVSESSISSPEQVYDLFLTGYRGFLIGETLMRKKNPGKFLEVFISDFKNRINEDEDAC